MSTGLSVDLLLYSFMLLGLRSQLLLNLTERTE
jgi:hypothetical protein